MISFLRGPIVLLVLFVVGCSQHSQLKITTERAAQDAILQHIGLRLKAEQALSVSPLLILGEPVKDFGAKGDPFWEVRCTDLHDNGEIDGIFWVHAQTGKIRQVHPRLLKDYEEDKPS